MNDTVATYIQQKYGKTIVTWSEDSGDSKNGTAQDSYNFYKAFADAGPGKPHMPLSHETKPAAIGALRMGTVPLLANAGIKLVTVAQCLDMEPYDYIGGYGQRDSSWHCGGTWTPPAPSCVTTYYSGSGDTCVSIGSKVRKQPYLVIPLTSLSVWLNLQCHIPSEHVHQLFRYTGRCSNVSSHYSLRLSLTDTRIVASHLRERSVVRAILQMPETHVLPLPRNLG